MGQLKTVELSVEFLSCHLFQVAYESRRVTPPDKIPFMKSAPVRLGKAAIMTSDYDNL